jgi:succinyl-CoA:acetate CoA-transferase
MLPPDHETQAIADHLVAFFEQEVEHERLGRSLAPLQVGVGSIANAVMCGLIDAPFSDLVQYSEVLQDSTFELLDAGKLKFASGCSITLSGPCGQRVFGNLDKYADRLVLRPRKYPITRK